MTADRRRPQGHVEPIRVRGFDQALQVDRVAVVGWRGVCSCGWTDTRRPTRPLAVLSLEIHLAREHGAGPLAFRLH